MRQIHYVMIVRHLTGDSEVKIFDQQFKAKEFFYELVEPLLNLCREEGLEEDEVYYASYAPTEPKGDIIGWRFNSGENEALDGELEDSTTYICWGTVDVANNVTHYVAEFSEEVDISEIHFYTKELAESRFNELVTEELDIADQHHGNEISREDKDTWENDEGMTLYSETVYPDHTDVYFGYADMTSTYRICELD